MSLIYLNPLSLSVCSAQKNKLKAALVRVSSPVSGCDYISFSGVRTMMENFFLCVCFLVFELLRFTDKGQNALSGTGVLQNAGSYYCLYSDLDLNTHMSH